jgi:hypothetical protein
MENFLDFEAIPPDSLWIAADGGAYGLRVIGRDAETKDIICEDMQRGTPRRINWFKLQYRYKLVEV